MGAARLHLIRLFVLLLLCWSSAGQTQSADADPIVAVIHPSIETKQLSVIQLRKIFSMRQSKWPNGLPVKVFVLSSKHPVHTTFCKRTLKMFPYQLEQVWNKLTYSGLGDPPILVADADELLKRVSQTPGSIGYSYRSKVPANLDVIEISKE